MKDTSLSLPSLPCMCASFRRASRALTQIYDEALRPLGLRVTQFTLLQALSLTGEISQGELGEVLALDSTTLSRTLQIMLQRQWIEERPGRDRRERRLRLAKAGQEQFRRAMPHWQKAQTRLRSALGDSRWHDLLQASNQLTNILSNF